MINAVKEKWGGPEEPWQLPFTVVWEGFWVFTKSYYVLGAGYWSKVEIQQWTGRQNSCPHRAAFSWKKKDRKSNKRCGQKVVSVREGKAERRQRSVCGRRGGFIVLNGDAGRGLLGKWHLNQGQGEGRVVCSILVEKVISLSLPYPVQAHPAYMSNSYMVMKWFCFCFSPMLYLGAGDWLLFSPALNAGVWHIIGAGCNN